jgi:hypothetical protein
MSDVAPTSPKPYRRTPPPEIAALSPPLSPKLEKGSLPDDSKTPRNYVEHTLKTTKALPPIGWHNWWKELNWLNVAILTITPAIAIFGAFTTRLRWQTAVFSVFYYFVTGLGITAGESEAKQNSFPARPRRSNGMAIYRLSPTLGSPIVQCVQTTRILPRNGRRRRGRGLHQMVVAWSPRTSPLHRHRP